MSASINNISAERAHANTIKIYPGPPDTSMEINQFIDKNNQLAHPIRIAPKTPNNIVLYVGFFLTKIIGKE